MRPIFSPTEYIQIKGRGTRRFTFVIGNTEYEKRWFFLLDFCGVAEYFEDKYDYFIPLALPRPRGGSSGGIRYPLPEDSYGIVRDPRDEYMQQAANRSIPVWEGSDRVVSQEGKSG
jgi:hypothetical protein